MRNLIKLVPSLAGNIPSLDLLLPMLSELASSRTTSRTTPTAATSHQLTSDELISPSILVPRLQATPSSPSTSTAPQPVHLVREPIYRYQRSKHTSEDNTTEPVSVEVDFLWNRAVDSLKTSFHPLLWTSSGLKE